MTQRDLAWRGVGAVAFLFAAGIGLADRLDGGSLLALPAFGLALIGLVLIVQGKRVCLRAGGAQPPPRAGRGDPRAAGATVGRGEALT